MPIDQSKLNERVADVTKLLARVLEPWVQDIDIEVQGDCYQIFLFNTFQDDHPLEISTANCEITLQYGEMHTHFSSTAENLLTEDQLVGEMLKKIVRIVDGVDRSFSAWSDDCCLGFGWLSENGDLSKTMEKYRLANRFKITAWVLEDTFEIHRDPRLGLGATSGTNPS